MSNLVIVAIPDENDRVWKVSSEKIPHMTLLFLGDMDQVQNLDQILGFVEHAASTTLKRFYLPVDRRGELGADQADVLFFKKGRYDYKAIRDFRAALLQDNNINTAYDSATQFEGPWNPHLTLGYPAAPAKEIPDDQIGTFYDVSFDRIAVWTNDFEGPEFVLKDYWDEYETLEVAPMDVAMSAIRHADNVSDTPWSNFADSDFDDAQWKRSCILDRGADFNTSKQRYAIPVREPSGTLNRKAIARAAAILSSKGGFGNARGNKINATHEQLVTARNKLIAIYNSVGEDVPEGLKTEAKQSAVLDVEARGAEFLAHYGVKGMRWGIRGAEATTTQTHIDTGLLKRRTQIQAKGGTSQPAHTDAVKAAVAKQVIKKSGTNALSTQELRDLANRLQVENQVGILMSSKGKQFVSRQLETEGKQALKKGAIKSAPHVLRKARKGVATAATVGALAL